MTDDFEHRLTTRLQRLAQHAPATISAAPTPSPRRDRRSRQRVVWAGALALLVVVIAIAVVRTVSDGDDTSDFRQRTTTTGAGSLRAALAADGIDIDIYATLAALAPQRFCGAATSKTGATVASASTVDAATAAATTCFLDAVLSHNVVTLVRRYIDERSASLYHLEVVQSRTDDHFDTLTIDMTGSGAPPTALDCEGIIANESLNATPGPPYDPGFFKIHDCRTVDLATVRPAVDNPPPPAWFLDREPLPRCGAAPWRGSGSYSDRRLSFDTNDCITASIRGKGSTETGFTVENGPLRSTRWFRIAKGSTYEAIELIDDGSGHRSWQRYRCAIPLVGSDGTPSPVPLSALGCVVN